MQKLPDAWQEPLENFGLTVLADGKSNCFAKNSAVAASIGRCAAAHNRLVIEITASAVTPFVKWIWREGLVPAL